MLMKHYNQWGTSLISGRGGVAVGVSLPQLGAGCLFAPPYVYAYL